MWSKLFIHFALLCEIIREICRSIAAAATLPARWHSYLLGRSLSVRGSVLCSPKPNKTVFSDYFALWSKLYEVFVLFWAGWMGRYASMSNEISKNVCIQYKLGSCQFWGGSKGASSGSASSIAWSRLSQPHTSRSWVHVAMNTNHRNGRMVGTG